VASAGLGKYLQLWDIAGSAPLRTLSLDSYTEWIEFSPDGRLLVTASVDAVARLWDVTTGKKLSDLKGHKDRLWIAPSLLMDAYWRPVPATTRLACGTCKRVS